jgi:hypothetical protein
MDSELVQRTRYLLQARVRTAKSCPRYAFLTACRHLYDWISTEPLISGLLAPLAPTVTSHHDRLQAIVAALVANTTQPGGGPPQPSDTKELAAIGMAILRMMSQATSPEGSEAIVAHWYLGAARKNYQPRAEEYTEAIRDVAIDAVYQFVDERIDTRNVTLALLRKYKVRCEQFRRSRLYECALVGLEGKKGEDGLVVDLHEYMHDRGVDFHIEPSSAAGWPDIVTEKVGGTRLVLDAKWIGADSPPSEVARIARSGFTQVFSYLQEYDEPVGYLAIFNGCDVVPEIEGELHDGFPSVSLATRAIYFVVIDLHAHDRTASKRPAPRTVLVKRAETLRELHLDDGI